MSTTNQRDQARQFLQATNAKVDIESLKTATKATTAGELIGKRIVIIVGEHRGQAVLRISQMPPME